ncbi:hypothetical protein T05_8880 [Trichinella murrelli]|uniref:Uncharacterized protein n=1 Tax=Trichinella murrelli TaxID=144512 RepID=A0A0V0TPF9_9BILA|nr:hypothetical protein T05_8880 [Trichinella murrelli]
MQRRGSSSCRKSFSVENDDDTLIVDYIATIVTAETGIKPCPAVPACFHKVKFQVKTLVLILGIASGELNTAVINSITASMRPWASSSLMVSRSDSADRKDTNVAEAKTFRPNTSLVHPGRSGYD